MKKTIIPLTMVLMLVSCGPNNDRLIDQYEQAIKENNYSEAVEILKKIDDDKLTNQQEQRIMDISTGGASTNFQEMMLKWTNEAGAAANELMEELEELEEEGIEYDESFWD